MSRVPSEAATKPIRARTSWSNDQRERFSTANVNLGASSARGSACRARTVFTTRNLAPGEAASQRASAAVRGSPSSSLDQVPEPQVETAMQYIALYGFRGPSRRSTRIPSTPR